MAVNTFDALMAEVNGRISEADEAASQVNAAAAAANEAARSANEGVQAVRTVVDAAQEAAQMAQEAAQAWENVIVEARTAEAGSEASVTLTQEAGINRFSFVIPRGRDGDKGAAGDMGSSGVSFQLSGSSLYITTV